MFWGLIMEPQRRYTQKVKKSFHISMASLDISTSTDEPAQVMCGFEGRNYLLCTLRKPDLLQCPLDLNFEVGDELSLAANGKCHVHLTGYLTEEYDDEEDENEVDEGDVEEEEEVEGNENKKSKRSKKEVLNGPPAKKSKFANYDDESDTDIRAFLKKSLAETDDDDETFESDEEQDNDEDDDESEDLEEEEAESSLSEGGSDENEVEEPPKLKSKKNKQNGLPNKQEKQELSTPKQKEKEKKKKEQTETRSPVKDKSPSKKKVLQGGVIIEEVREGQGHTAKPGKFISVYYEGRLKQNDKVFDSATKGGGFSFRLGSGEVIKGWDVGVAGMKVGGKRRITCPPSMAYGSKGSPPAIPGNSILVFEVELKKVR